MKSNFEKISVEIYGESHSEKIGVIIKGIRPKLQLSLSEVKSLLSRRKSKDGSWATKRQEEDGFIIVSGLKDLGGRYEVEGDICFEIANGNVKPSDYELTKFRPSHADYTAFIKDGKVSAGGGRFSGRMTAPLCIAGGIAEELLYTLGIDATAYISSIGKVQGASYLNTSACLDGIDNETIKRIKSSDFPLLDDSFKEDMLNEINSALNSGDSVGGTVECVVTGLHAGMIGDALFEGLEGKIAYSVYGVPAVKGVEFGGGFEISKMRGSEANDAFYMDGRRVKTVTNFSGGINGGITNGMPVTLRVAIRPTPSIFKEQKTVSTDFQDTTLTLKGRHDACIVPRAVPCIESAVALAIFDEILKSGV